jgi:hypothetical protein
MRIVNLSAAIFGVETMRTVVFAVRGNDFYLPIKRGSDTNLLCGFSALRKYDKSARYSKTLGNRFIFLKCLIIYESKDVFRIQ